MNPTKKIGELNCTIVDRSTGSPKAAVIFCHGYGAPGTDLVPITDELQRMNPALNEVVFVFPQAPIELDPLYDSRAWWMIDIERVQALMLTGEFRELRQTVPPELESCRQQIFIILDSVMQQYDLSSDKIVIGGFSQGAMLTTDVALNYQHELAGLIVWSGTLMNEKGWIDAAQKKNQSLSVVQSHGYTDPILPFQGAEFLCDMLKKEGHNVEFIPFPGQHGIAAEAVAAAGKLVASIL